jgi:putative ABC transport system permease protein
VSGREIMAAALRGLSANKLRSMLTTLGILIGVGAVILLVAVGNGSAKQIKANIDQLGTNTVTVFGGGAGRRFGGGGAASSQNQQLTVRAAQALMDRTEAPDIKSVSPEVSTTSTVSYVGASTSTSVIGTYPAYFLATNSPIGRGSPFGADDVTGNRKVVVIGQTVATNLFDTVNPLDKQIVIGATPFTVVGVLADKGATGFEDPNDTIIAPLTTVQEKLTGYGAITSIVVQATSADTVDAAQSEATTILDEELHVTNAATAPYRILNQSQLLATRTQANKTFTVLLASVAAISLLVGGIGITNIMLVTVTERTREIGIRKALGAPKRAILAQFLTEATLLSLVGGLLGVLAGMVGSRFTIVGVHPVVVPGSIALALGVCVVIGVFFGGYPANRAASLRPVDALRYE